MRKPARRTFSETLRKLVRREIVVHMTETANTGVPTFSMGDRLRKARELTGLDQEQFAEKVGFSRGTVSNYERSTTEKRKPLYVRQWAMATGVPLEWLETGTGPVTTPPDGGKRATKDAELARLTERKRRAAPSRSANADKRRYPSAA